MSRVGVLEEFRGIHGAESIIVCGCGVSLSELPPDHAGITIGVNDVGRHIDPSYLVVMNPRQQFHRDRYRFVEESRARVIFTQLNTRFPHPRVVRFRLGARGGTDLSSSEALPYTRNSTYVALCLALFMGAKRVGLIGVDFTDHHFFGPTGRHPLARELDGINEEFRKLGAAARERGVEIVNLSATSRVTAFPKTALMEFQRAGREPGCSMRASAPSVFFVNYRFKTCGDVFCSGLTHAAEELGVSHASADWDNPGLDRRIAAAKPDLLFVVHGRQFVRRWGNRISHQNTAVWLLDEPYEVDDTAIFSSWFRTVFVNDFVTVGRHRNAHYLPTAFDPRVHRDTGQVRDLDVGFVGGANPSRERLLCALQEAGRLTYVVGGPWRSKALRSLCIAPLLPPAEVARLYQRTRVVVNAFRDRHHYNVGALAGAALNPRVYEALACGALVVSEYRPEAAEQFPSMPTFRDEAELIRQLDLLIEQPTDRDAALEDCERRLTRHSYARRFETVVRRCLGSLPTAVPRRPAGQRRCREEGGHDMGRSIPDGWTDIGGMTAACGNGTLRIAMAPDDRPGAERGLASEAAHADVELSFDVRLVAGTCFIAKIHQQDQQDQRTNSYHLMCRPEIAYLGMHNRILVRMPALAEGWHRVSLCHRVGRLELIVDGRLRYSRMHGELRGGFAFLGVKGGAAELRGLRFREPGAATPTPAAPSGARKAPPPVPQNARLMRDFGTDFSPRLSIITTVYDRVQCLADCIESVQRLTFRDFEHIIVADHPPRKILAELVEVIDKARDPRSRFLNLKRRHNDWGISPAQAGLRLSRGEYVCFLSDDNGYVPDHFQPLLSVLDRNPGIGFSYSSCLYDGRLRLGHSIPRPGGIDLGQPVFRRELFERYLGGGLPFDMMAWDWHLIKTLMDHGVKWRHVNRPTFLFRLYKYPALRGIPR